MVQILRPFGHLAVIDAATALDLSALVPKSISLHLEMVFGRALFGVGLEQQAHILGSVAALAAAGKIKPIFGRVLAGLSVESMRTAHENLEARRTIGKVVIDIAG
ncbi:MAG: hypothetical protein EOP11_15425 [Proteobacteria bacterium]|nr:MAG: hypothetical protein EOP11_15425 [Pseudomonadota bacterium]